MILHIALLYFDQFFRPAGSQYGACHMDILPGHPKLYCRTCENAVCVLIKVSGKLKHLIDLLLQ